MITVKDARSKIFSLNIGISTRRAPRFSPDHLKPKRIERNKKRPERGRKVHRHAKNVHTPIDRPEFMVNYLDLQLFFHGCLKQTSVGLQIT
jgi:hypothetical protein